ncbi:MAG TPA: AMP-binding protein [Burkholderiaceae bacterium]|nr:AMP-binding protein [Burkholderiaceae bacterium]
MTDLSLMATLQSFGERIAVHTVSASHSYRDLCLAVECQRERLRAAGVVTGETVFLQGGYSFDGIAMLLALYLNANIVAMNTSGNACEIDDKLRTAQAGFFADLRDGTLRDLRAPSGAAEALPLVERLREQGLAGLILFSSGTTGRPKAMLHDLSRLVESYLGRRPRQINMLLFLLFDHIGGINTVLNVLAIGGTATIPPQNTPEHVADMVERFKVNVLPTSPTFLNLLLLSGALDRHEMASLRLVTYGTEPMPAGLLARLRERLPRVRLVQTFGTSETGIISTAAMASDNLYMKFDDPAIEHKVVDGELWLRSKRRILGYLNHTSDALTDDGWFITGDAVEEQEDGSIRILGRRKEVINVGGEKGRWCTDAE